MMIHACQAGRLQHASEVCEQMTTNGSPHHRIFRYRYLILPFISLLSCVLVLALGELAARWARPNWAPVRAERVEFWRYDPVLGWSHNPGQKGVLHHVDWTIHISINSQGLRDKEYPIQRTGKRRMLVIGDSYAWGFGVEQNQCFSKILERDHPDWEIINAGVSGYGTDQEYLYLKEHGLKYRPDIVLLEFYSNDIETNARGEDSWYFKPYFVEENGSLVLKNSPVPGATLRQRMDRLLYGRTYLLEKIYGSAVNAAAALKSRLVGAESENSAAVLLERGAGVTRRLLGAIKELCESQGSRFVIVSVPMSVQYRAFLQDACRKEDIKCLPLDSYFESTGRITRFPHDRHWNPAGHEIAAKGIEDFLKGMGVF